MIKINSWEISTWPRAQICPKFGDVNICRVDMLNGYRLEILFTSYGYPLVKQSVIAQIQQYYNKRFIPISIDDDLAYASVVCSRGTPANSDHQTGDVKNGG